MEIPDDLKCMFNAKVTKESGDYTIRIPEQEVTLGGIQANDVLRVALLSGRSDSRGPEATENESHVEPTGQDNNTSGPPVKEGETRTVEIETLGDQGDGITRVEHGYVIIVPETETGERVTVEITDVRENVAFADVVERVNYYE